MKSPLQIILSFVGFEADESTDIDKRPSVFIIRVYIFQGFEPDESF